MAQRSSRLFRKAARVLRHEGPRMLLARSFAKASGMLVYGTKARPTPQQLLVDDKDAAVVNWTQPLEPVAHPIVVRDGALDVAWISSAPGAESGGHQNMFRFIDFLERAGHRATIYLYDKSGATIDSVQAMLRNTTAYPDLKARIVRYNSSVGVESGTQAMFATGWETAYPAFRDPSTARRFYFVQDFEPSFYPVGTEYLLAENTYRFGFHGITAGRWLSEKLHSEYGMVTDHFDFAVDKQRYHVTSEKPRREVFFYARPVTARRAFEFGVLALSDFAKLRPDVAINFAGWDIRPWKVPFKHRNLAALDISELNALYNRCAAGLVLSLTNMSLLPLELMAAGTVPVVNDAPNNRLVYDGPYMEWVPPSPLAIAQRLADVVDRADGPVEAQRMSDSITQSDWSESGRQFVGAFERAMRG